MKRLLSLTAAVLIVLACILLPLTPDAASGTWVESTTPTPNELPSTWGQAVVFNFSRSQNQVVSVRHQAQVWNGYFGEDAKDIDYWAKYRLSVFEPQQNGTVKTLYYSNTNEDHSADEGKEPLGPGETFQGHSSDSLNAEAYGIPAGTEVKAEASTEVTAYALDDDDQVIQSQWSVSDSINWTMPE